ncbi:hypothetical protein [Brachybacterium sp. YJGR34]|uniref:hypothetical protein n=1 Tax=Brachybacterium sp. YJGR34 TaxID=2059911 RepID=UPI001300B0D9|nr:hypothetical protein [Brachybacterium sp. YJGR34]
MNGADLVLAVGELLANPSPSDGEEFNSVTVSPGLPGFFATFVLAAAIVLLVIDMTRRTRRVQARARVEERMRAEREAAQKDPAEHGPEGDGTGDPSAGDGGPSADGGGAPEDEGGSSAAEDERPEDQSGAGPDARP